MIKTFAITATAAAIMAFSQAPAQAGMVGLQMDNASYSQAIVHKTGDRYYDEEDSRYEYHRLSRRRFTKREYDRLPIRVTRPGNTGHYTFQDFPHWAARAFQPHRTR